MVYSVCKEMEMDQSYVEIARLEYHKECAGVESSSSMGSCPDSRAKKFLLFRTVFFKRIPLFDNIFSCALNKMKERTIELAKCVVSNKSHLWNKVKETAAGR